MTPPPVHWHEGMFLRPHHFQAAQRHAEHLARLNSRWDVHYNWGLHRLEFDPDALPTYRFAVRRLEVRFRDGTLVSLPEDGPAPDLDLKGPLERSPSVTIYLAVPKLNLGQPNADHGASDSVRFRVESLELEDENTGVNPQELAVRRLNVRLFAGEEEHAGFEVIPLARVQRSARAEALPQLDVAYIPPILCCDAWPVLSNEILQPVFNRLGKKIELLAGLVTSRGLTLDSHGQGDALIVGQLARLNEGAAMLSNLAFLPGVHPLPVYLELCRLVGQMAIFSDAARVPELPLYDHDDLGMCFWRVKQYIDDLLDRVREPGYQERDFIGAGLRMQVTLEPAWLEPAWQMFIGVRSPLSNEECVRLLTRPGSLDMKVGSTERVDEIFRKGQPGLRFTPSPSPPRALPRSPDLTYLQVSRDVAQSEWQFVQKSLTLAIRLNEKLVVGGIDSKRILTIPVGGQTINLQFTLYVLPQAGGD